MKSIVTGCAGFIGSHLSEELLSKGHKVIGYDSFDNYYSLSMKQNNMKNLLKNPDFKFQKISITSSSFNIPDGIDTIYHLAAIPGVRNSFVEPRKYYDINVIGTVSVMELARQKDINKVVFASSSSVYGNISAINSTSESSPLNPISPYGMSKKIAEEIVQSYSDLHGVSTSILRYFSVYGERQRPDEVMSRFIYKALTRDKIQIYGDGTQKRDYTYVKDIVSGTVLAGKKGKGIYNIGSGKTYTVNEIKSFIENAIGYALEVEHIDQQKGDVTHTFADISKSKSELGYSPSTNIMAGIKNQIEFMRNEGIRQ